MPTIVSDTTAVNIATVNPFRYRGYYYDNETQLYYLQSRYYDPVVARFVNADDININIAISENAICNLFTYCKNNSVNYSGPTGYSAQIAVLIIALIIIGVVGGIIKVAALHETESYKKTIGGGKFLRTVIEFMLGVVQGLFTTFFLALVGTISIIATLAIAAGSAIKEFIKCKGRLSASVFNEFVNGLTKGVVNSVIGTIIDIAIKSKNIGIFISTLISELQDD